MATRIATTKNQSKLPNNANNPRLLAALNCARRGWLVFPCRPKDKRPATRNGFKDATTEKATIVGWWTRRRDCNVAIATGSGSGLLVLDIDPRNGGNESLADLERTHGALPQTVTVATGGGGRHYYFTEPRGASCRVLADGIDVKANGGYVVAPPSMHPDGGKYRWINDPQTTPLVPCPEWVFTNNSPAKVLSGSTNILDAKDSELGRAFELLGMLGRRLEGGKRTVVCPWLDKHTTGVVWDSSTVIFPPNQSGVGGFHCSHSHCTTRGVAEVCRELERRSFAASADRAWMADLRRTTKGELKSSFGNVVLILTNDTAFGGRLRFNEMSGSVNLGEHEVTDASVSAMRVDLEKRYDLQPGDAEMARAVQLVASKNAFHPVRDFLRGLVSDGVKRLDRVAADILRVRCNTADELAICSLLVRKWFLCLVARALAPGCKVDTALILEGTQGAGKSTFFRLIAREWFSDTEMSPDKDALMQLRSAWVYEWAELENVTSRQSVSWVKAFLSSTDDKYRPPFGRTPITVKRSGVIVGTTNTQDFLHDPSGSRRFWVIPVGLIDVALLKLQREQLLAEAVALYMSGEQHWLSEQEEVRRSVLAARFQESDPWEDRVLGFAARQDRVRVTEVLEQALDISLGKQTRREEQRVTSILRRACYRPEQRRVDGKSTRFWERQETAASPGRLGQ